MKKLLLSVFILVLAISCTSWQDVLLPDSSNVTIFGGHDIGFQSHVKVENIESGDITSETYNAKYGDGIPEWYRHDVVRSQVDKMIVRTYPSDVHDVKIFVEGIEKKISNGSLVLDDKPWEIDIVFSLKEPHIKEPTLIDNTYEIKTAEELRWVSSQSQRSNTFQGKTIKLMNNIDMQNSDFTGIAVNSTNLKFSGTFDGNNYEVKNFNIKVPYTLAGFIGTLSSSGVVKNLTVSATMSEGPTRTGGIVAENYGVIEKCVNNSLVEGYSYTGGIAGKNYGAIENCVNNSSVKGDNYTGGIVGVNIGSIKNVVNNGIITSKKDTGIGQIIGGKVEGSTVENATENGSTVKL